jgi:hypothetical protein
MRVSFFPVAFAGARELRGLDLGASRVPDFCRVIGVARVSWSAFAAVSFMGATEAARVTWSVYAESAWWAQLGRLLLGRRYGPSEAARVSGSTYARSAL